MGEVRSIISLLLCGIFILLALLHFAWALGVKWGFEAALPTDQEGNRVLNPKSRDSLIVGLGLALFSAFYLAKSQGVQLTPNEIIETVISWLIPSIFLLRSIGDFKYVGIFKKVKGTNFGKLDTRLIIPLCLIVSILGFLSLFS